MFIPAVEIHVRLINLSLTGPPFSFTLNCFKPMLSFVQSQFCNARSFCTNEELVWFSGDSMVCLFFHLLWLAKESDKSRATSDE